jgi:hypothetical protein
MSHLRTQKIQADHLLVNRAWPDWLDLSRPSLAFSDTQSDMKNYYDKVYNYYHNQKEQIQKQLRLDHSGLNVYFLPEKVFFEEDVLMQSMQKTLLEAFS